MEQRSDQQAFAHPAANAASTPATSAGGGLVFRRTLRLLVRRFVYVAVLLLRPLRRFALFALVVAALLGIIGWLSFRLLSPQIGTVSDTRAAYISTLR